jgi:F-type H+-transporting ATPase subunit beta
LTPEVVGERHYQLAGRVQAIMQKYDSLKNIIAIVGENELSPADRADYQNAKKLIQFFNQDFSVAEKFSGKPGEYFTLEQTLSGIEAILSGKADDGKKDVKIEAPKAETKPEPAADSKPDDTKSDDKPAEATKEPQPEDKPTESKK